MQPHYNTTFTEMNINLNSRVSSRDFIYYVSSWVNSLPDSLFKPYSLGRHQKISDRLLVIIVIFAFYHNIRSSRKIAELIKYDIRLILLTHGQTISYRTIERFMDSYQQTGLIDNLFDCLNYQLTQAKVINNDVAYIDGTIIRADSYKYGFVWRKSVIKFLGKLKIKVCQLEPLLLQLGIFCNSSVFSDPNLSKMDQSVNTMIIALNKINTTLQEKHTTINRSKLKKTRRKLKKYLRIAKELRSRMAKYLTQLDFLGKRNSYAKTDTDATFMHFKDDPMNNGQVKPGYNLQIATNDGFVIDYDIYQRPADSKTLIPFVEKSKWLQNAQVIVADAGYGSEQNYNYLKKLGIKPLLEYATYRQEQKRNYQKKLQWHYDETTDSFTDNKGIKFVFHGFSVRHDKQNNFTHIFRTYRPIDYLDGDPKKELSLTDKDAKRTHTFNRNWYVIRKKITADLEEKFYQLLFSQRKIED